MYVYVCIYTYIHTYMHLDAADAGASSVPGQTQHLHAAVHREKRPGGVNPGALWWRPLPVTAGREPQAHPGTHSKPAVLFWIYVTSLSTSWAILCWWLFKKGSLWLLRTVLLIWNAMKWSRDMTTPPHPIILYKRRTNLSYLFVLSILNAKADTTTEEY